MVFGQSLCVHTPVHKLLTATRTSVRTAGPLNPDPPLILAVESPRLAGRSSADDMDFGQGELPVSRLVRGGCVRSSGRCTLLLPWCRSPLGACLGLYRRRRAPLSPVRPYHWERQVDGGRRRFLFTFGRLGSGEKAVGAAGGRRGAQRSSARRRAVGAPQHGTGSSGRVLSSNASLPFHRWCCILDSQRMRDHRAPEGAGQTTQPLNAGPSPIWWRAFLLCSAAGQRHQQHLDGRQVGARNPAGGRSASPASGAKGHVAAVVGPSF